MADDPPDVVLLPAELFAAELLFEPVVFEPEPLLAVLLEPLFVEAVPLCDAEVDAEDCVFDVALDGSAVVAAPSVDAAALDVDGRDVPGSPENAGVMTRLVDVSESSSFWADEAWNLSLIHI